MEDEAFGVRCLRSVVALERVEAWRAMAQRALAELPAGHRDRQPTSGSLRVRALGADWLKVFDDALRPWALGVASATHADWVLLDSEAWFRVQHPAALRPSVEHPHAWHQDGALGFNFSQSRQLPAVPRSLRTLWMPMVDCGRDAPSLEWIEPEECRLLWPDELPDAALLGRDLVAQRRVATLAAGDALVFGGGLLHRTHVTPAMSGSRISLELRWERQPRWETIESADRCDRSPAGHPQRRE